MTAPSNVAERTEGSTAIMHSETTPNTSTDATDEAHVPLVEEQAVIEKREVERVGARIHMRTHEEEVPFSETLRREHVEVERVPLGTIVDEAPVSREENGALIVPVVEEVLVKRFRVIEEVRITSRAEMVETEDTVTLRRQEAVVEEAPPPSRAE